MDLLPYWGLLALPDLALLTLLGAYCPCCIPGLLGGVLPRLAAWAYWSHWLQVPAHTSSLDLADWPRARDGALY